MQQTGFMSLKEKTAIGLKAIELRKQGKEEEWLQTMKSMPLPSYLAKWAKKRLGADFLINGGWNLAEADAEYGQDWLIK
jgi:hypothetical protein